MTTDEQSLDEFFSRLKAFYGWYKEMTGERPKLLVISPQLLQRLAKLEGFFQRPELGTEVTPYSPVVRRFKLTSDTVVELYEDPNEPFLHYE